MSELTDAIDKINASASATTRTTTFFDDVGTADDSTIVTNPNNGKQTPSIKKQVKDQVTPELQKWEGEHNAQMDKFDQEFYEQAQYKPAIAWAATTAVSDKFQLYSESTNRYRPNPSKIPFTTGATINDDLANGLWLAYAEATLDQVNTISNAGDSHLAGGKIWPADDTLLPLGTQSTPAPSGVSRLTVDTGVVGGELLYLWEPSGDFGASAQTITDISLGTSGQELGAYVVTTNIQTYTFTTADVRKWRGADQTSLRLSVDARGWGYKGDGIFDDAPSVRAAGEYIDGSGGSIELPVTENGGLFASDDGINGIAFIVPARSRLFSQATNLEDETQTGGLIIRKDGNFTAIRLGGFSSEVENLTVLGSPGNGGGGIQLYGNNCVISRCASMLHATYGIKLGSETEARNCNNWKLDQVISRANMGDGFDIRGFDPGGGPDLNNGVAIKCQAFNNGNDGFVFEQTFVSTYIQCYAEGNGRFGYNLGTACSNNTFINPGSEGNDSNDPDSQFAVGAGSFNNILMGSFLYDPFDPNNLLTVVRSTGGANAYCKLSDRLAIGGGFPTNNAIDSGITVSGSIPGVILGDIDGPADQNNLAFYHNSGRTFFRYFEADGTPHDWFNSTRNVDNTVLRTVFEGQLAAADGLGVGNSSPATTLGSVVGRTQVYDEAGNILGFIPIYDNIT